MSQEDPKAEGMAVGTIEFVSFHVPVLQDGDYLVEVTQRVEAGEIDETFTVERRFAIAGPRFDLPPQEVSAVFPPKGGLGEYSDVFPHVVFRRSTLPWERCAIRPPDEETHPQRQLRRETPWLVLLLFSEGELPELHSVPVGELGLALETGQKAEDLAHVIEVQRSLLQALLPSAAALRQLAHVRQVRDGEGMLEAPEEAVLICSRLPASGQTSAVHLVSLEGRYSADESFDWDGADQGDPVRLVSLACWQFACVSAAHTFHQLLLGLDRQPPTLRLPGAEHEGMALAEPFLREGLVAVPHQLRQGQRTVSWYRGPLLGGPTVRSPALPAHHADALLIYRPSIGMFDVSYAAAWELGRHLALADKGFSVALYHWKRAVAQALMRRKQQEAHPHLPSSQTREELPAVPQTVRSWFKAANLLGGVPFHYLVPDPRMLPPESIRFFLLDNGWVEALLDGALSIGRVTRLHHLRDQLRQDNPARVTYPVVSGFLMRSQVVSGWPDLLVVGYPTLPEDSDQADEMIGAPLRMLRRERLSEHVLLCLFEGEVSTIDVEQRPERLHFGLDTTEADGTLSYWKRLRGADGEQLSRQVDRVPWQDEALRVVEMVKLAGEAQSLLGSDMTPARFALEMIEGVQRVRFLREPASLVGA
jgi:hypothetical protein